MSYAKLGTDCNKQTIANTSNYKFIIPDSPVYLLQNTIGWRCPDLEPISGQEPSGFDLLSLKSYKDVKGNGCTNCQECTNFN